MTVIYKICQRKEWLAAEQHGEFRGSKDDVRDGFIHLSTAAQLAGTLAKHFAGATNLLLVAVDAGALGRSLRWETSRGGDLFPHLYAALPLKAVRWTRPIADEVNGDRSMPELSP
jgi:uncharacterized protein (DUF952 family)